MATQTQNAVSKSHELPSTPEVSPKSGSGFVEGGGNFDSCSDGYKALRDEKSRGEASPGLTETQAAYTLMQLAMRKDEVKHQVKSRKRRASA